MMLSSWLALSLLLATGHVCQGDLSIVSVGDWGQIQAAQIVNQEIVAAALDAWCGTHVCEFILSTGDNFYEQGVTSTTDPRWDSTWKNMYDGPNLIDKNWYISIGNHDHDAGNPGDGRERYQVDYGQIEPRWIFPEVYYDFLYDDGTVTVHFVVIDSQSLRLNKNDPASQLAWLDDTLAASAADWKIVVTHHPPYSTGNYGPTDATIERDVVPLCEQHNVDLVISGHDHNLQHITKTDALEIDYIITGGGGRYLYPYDQAAESALNQIGYQVDLFEETFGFTTLEFSATTMVVQHINTDGNIIYDFTRTK